MTTETIHGEVQGEKSQFYRGAVLASANIPLGGYK